MLRNIREKGSITKAHISQSIVKHEENFERLKQLFYQIPNRGMFIEAMMNEGCTYFLERETLSPAEAIQAIHDAHGVAIFAHPIASLYEDMDMTALRDVISNTNFDALEAFYYYHDQSRGRIGTAVIGDPLKRVLACQKGV